MLYPGVIITGDEITGVRLLYKKQLSAVCDAELLYLISVFSDLGNGKYYCGTRGEDPAENKTQREIITGLGCVVLFAAG